MTLLGSLISEAGEFGQEKHLWGALARIGLDLIKTNMENLEKRKKKLMQHSGGHPPPSGFGQRWLPPTLAAFVLRRARGVLRLVTKIHVFWGRARKIQIFGFPPQGAPQMRPSEGEIVLEHISEQLWNHLLLQ